MRRTYDNTGRGCRCIGEHPTLPAKDSTIITVEPHMEEDPGIRSQKLWSLGYVDQFLPKGP